MNSSLFHLRADIDAETARECSAPLFEIIGPHCARTWPRLEEWLKETVPGFPADDADQRVERFQLEGRELRKLLDPGLDTIYHVTDPELLTRFILAVDRHSELMVDLLPLDVSRGKLVHLLRLADRFLFAPPDDDALLRAEWLLAVGLCDGDEPALLLLTDDDELHAHLLKLLSPIIIRPEPETQGALI